MKQVKTDIFAYYANENVNIPCQISYYPEVNPYAVNFTFNNDVNWVFDRNLLMESLNAQAGEGDVVVTRLKQCVVVSLRVPGNAVAHFAFQTEEFYRTAIKIFSLVPPGAESEFVDWDKEFALLVDPKPDA